MCRVRSPKNGDFPFLSNEPGILLSCHYNDDTSIRMTMTNDDICIRTTSLLGGTIKTTFFILG
jgi:hypothetical protein